MRTPSASLLYSHLLTESTCFQVGYVDCGSARPRHDKTLFLDGGGAHPRVKFRVLPGNPVTSRRRRVFLSIRSLTNRIRIKKKKVKKVLIGDDLFRYIYPSVLERQDTKRPFSLLCSFEETNAECIECAPSPRSGPRRSSVSNERESYLITNVWGVLETMVDREAKYRSSRSES